MEAELQKAYECILRQRERAKRNYQSRREEILQKRKEKRELELEGKERRKVGRPRLVKNGTEPI